MLYVRGALVVTVEACYNTRMILEEISASVSRLPGAGAVTEKQLAKLGVKTIGQLLAFWPRDWEDRRRAVLLYEAQTMHKAAVALTIIGHDFFGFGNMRTLKLIAEDEQGARAELLCFHREFLKDRFPVGSTVLVYGSFYVKYNRLQASSFEIDVPDRAVRGLLPVYPLTQGLTQKKIRKLIAAAFKTYSHTIDSNIPELVRADYNLPEKKEIIRCIHFPQTLEETHLGTRALIFEEFFLFQYALGLRALQTRGSLPSITTEHHETAADSPVLPNMSPLQKQVQSRLPFTLTDDQLKTIYKINEDLHGENPMARLIQGDVGSGKTLTAFFAAVRCIEAGGQAALLAPTELLARQHANTAANLLEALGIRPAFLSGSVTTKGRKNLLRALSEGSIDFIIGTHALFSEDVRYHNLTLVIIDEQQRFGVLQRAALIQKGSRHMPHMLMMSATPIPRTLALSVFGDLDISIIKTMPQGRKPVITYAASMEKSEQVYFQVGKEILAGRQAYFLYPLIEDSPSLSLKSAQTMFSRLKQGFPEHTLALLHARIPEDEQRKIMQGFQEGTIHILVATSVVEVGVDVPNATCMVIEHAERFGLSALHQLRGRVGRGREQSYCFLLYGKALTENGRERIKIMKETTDGFIIAEKDLKMRGPGDIGGMEQSGYLGFTIANPIRDFELLQQARNAAFSHIQKQH